MRYGICLPGNFSLGKEEGRENDGRPDSGRTSEPLRALLDGWQLIRRVGYDYIEFGVGGLMALSDEEMETAAAYCRQGLLRVEACNCFIPGSLPLIGEQCDPEAVRAYAEKALNRMASVGAETVVFGSGAARRVPDGVSAGQAAGQLECFLIMAESIARPLGITVVIEPLNHRETNSLLTVTESAGIVRRLGLPNLRLLADLYHTCEEKEDPRVLTENADLLRHIHVAQPGDRSIPTEHPYLRSCGRALREAGYSGRISIECGYRDLIPEVTAALPVLRSMFG